MSNRKIQKQIPIGCSMTGEVVARVLENGKVVKEYPPQKNLILYPGILDVLNTPVVWSRALTFCRAGTGTTANSTAPDGTFARAGTTVTRSTGTGTFSPSDAGKSIKFGSGEEAYIVTYTSPTEVETRETGTISATTIVLWGTEQTALVAEASSTSTKDGGASSNTDTHDTGAATSAFKRTWNFPAEVGAVTYNEVGVSRLVGSDLLSRIVLGSSVNVGIGQQLQIQYTLTMAAAGFVASTAVSPTVTGWPRPYVIDNITSTGSNFDVQFTEDHHYSASDEITISNALPTKVAISTFSSTPTEFTVTTSAVHGLSVSDSIEIENAGNASYDGTWTVAAVDSTTVFRVTSAINPGASSGGTVRLTTPGTWYNGTWTVASAPATDTIRITSAINPIDAGEGDVEGTLDGDARFQGTKVFGEGASTSDGSICDPISVGDRSLQGFTGTAPTLSGLGNVMPSGSVTATRSETLTVVAAEHEFTYHGVFDIDEMNSETILGFGYFGFGSSNMGLLIALDQNQRKDSGYSLDLGIKVTFRPTLA